MSALSNVGRALHEALIPRVARVPKELPASIAAKLEARGVKLAKRQANIAARSAKPGTVGKAPAKGAAVKVPAPVRAAPAPAPAEKPPVMVFDRSKVLSVREERDGTFRVQLAPTPEAIEIAMAAHQGRGPKKGSREFAAAIASAMRERTEEVVKMIAEAAPDAVVRVKGGSTETATRNIAPRGGQ